MDITVTLTDEEALALSYNHTEFDFYINSLAIGQVNLAQDKISEITVKHCLDNGIQVPATREAIVAYAFDNDIVETAAQQQVKVQAGLEAQPIE
jgi:hypothetical protein